MKPKKHRINVYFGFVSSLNESYVFMRVFNRHFGSDFLFFLNFHMDECACTIELLYRQRKTEAIDGQLST